MPSNYEALNFNTSNSGEVLDDSSRLSYRERGDTANEVVVQDGGIQQPEAQKNKAELRKLSDMSISELLQTSKEELNKYSLEELIAARERLKQEYKKRTGADIPSSTKASAENSPAPKADDRDKLKQAEAKEIEEAEAREKEQAAAEEIEKAVQASEANIDNDAEAAAIAAITGTEATAPQTETVAAAPAATEATPQAADISSDPTEPLAQPVETTEETTGDASEAAPNLATISPEKAAATIEKAKQKRSLKSILTKKVLPVLLAMGLLVPSVAAVVGNANSAADTQQQTPAEQVYSSYDEYAASGEQHEQHGIQDRYYEKGMFANKDLSHGGAINDFANAAEVAEAIGQQDECEVMKHVDHCQVESFADHLAGLPDSVKAKYGLSQFTGLSILETENALQNLSPDEYDNTLKKMDQVWDDAFTETVTLDGTYQNAYMASSAAGDEAVTHENTKLVSCTTQENGTQATRFFWTTDGNGNSDRIGDVTGKISRDDNGRIIQGENKGNCTQLVFTDGTRADLYQGMDEITVVVTPPVTPPETPPVTPPETPPVTPPETPPGTPPETPQEQIAPKDAENLTRIDNQINQDIANDIGTEQINITPTDSVDQADLTPQPTAEDYQGTEPTIVQNETSEQATPVQETVSEANDYSQNQGGANAGEYAPVQANEQAQAAADAAETPVDQAPTSGQELDNALDDLGIN